MYSRDKDHGPGNSNSLSAVKITPDKAVEAHNSSLGRAGETPVIKGAVGHGHNGIVTDLPAIEPVPQEQPVSGSVVAPADAPASHKEEAENLAIIENIEPGAAITPVEHRAVRRQVLNLAWPVIIENLLQTLIGVVDTALVGHLSTAALAGVGGAQQIIWLLTSALAAVTMGTTVLIAHAIGANNRDDAKRAFKQSMILSAGIAISLGGLVYLAAAPLMYAIGMTGDAAESGIIYLQITALTMPVFVAMFAGSAALRGAGNTRTPMYITAFINIINAAAAWVLIYGFGPIPELGVAGSAWAAGIARLVGTALLLWVFMRPNQTITLLGKNGWRPNLDIMRRMMRIGIPTMLEQFFISFGLTVFGVIVVALGTEVYAAQRASMTIVMLSLLPGFGFAMAATTLVGQAMGANNKRLAELGTNLSSRYCIIMMSVAGLLFAIFAEPLVSIFSSDPEVTKLGAEVLRIIALNQPFMAIASTLSGGLRGAGDTKFPLLVNAVGIWAIRVPLGWLIGIPLGFGLHGIYAVYVFDAILRAGAIYWRWKQGKWQALKV